MKELINNTVDLKSIIEDAGVELIRRGRRYVGRCPFHSDGSPSFYVFDDQKFKCFGCGEYGDAVDFVQKLHGLSFPEALKHLGLKRGRMTPEIRQRIRYQKLKTDVLKRFEKWQSRYLAHLGTLINRTLKLMKNIPEKDLFWYAPLLHGLPIWEYHSDILLNGSDRAKFQLYKEVCRYEQKI